MGKSLNGKELGKGITQRKDGLYMARFTNRFGKQETMYDKTYNGIRKKLRTAQYEDENKIHVVSSKITLDEWCEKWLSDFKCHCRASTKQAYLISYNRISKELGWRKVSTLNLCIIQEAINKIESQYSRQTTRKILADMLEKAVDTGIILENPVKKVNIKKDGQTHNPRKRVLTKHEQNLFLKLAEDTYYYNLFVVALETGMRVGELCGLKWDDIDFDNKVLYVRRTMVYYQKANENYVHEIHEPKTASGIRTIPLTKKATNALKSQYIQKSEIEDKGMYADDGFEDLVFVTRNNKPTQQFLINQCMDLITNRIKDTEPDFRRITPHTLRHTFATRAIENGMNLKSLQVILGHKQLSTTTDIYCHVTQDTLYEEMSKME